MLAIQRSARPSQLSGVQEVPGQSLQLQPSLNELSLPKTEHPRATESKRSFVQWTRVATIAVAAVMMAFSFIGPTPEASAQQRTPVATVTVAQQTPEERELVDKVGRLVERRFGGSMDRAFAHYAGRDNLVSKSELMRLLEDAGIGNFLTRGLWADGIIEKFDSFPGAIKNGKVDRAELDYAMRQR